MSTPLPPGPFTHIQAGPASVPLYLIDFDKYGNNLGPRTREHLLQTVKSGQITDVYVFSHGWNNNFKAALELYRGFYEGYGALRAAAVPSEPWKAVFVGIIWPSTALVLPWEKGPQFAAASDESERVESQDGWTESLSAVAGAIDPAKVARFYDLANRDKLTGEEAQELAEILLPVYNLDSDELPGSALALDAPALRALWSTLQPRDTARHGFADDGPAAAPSAAGDLGFLDPRQPVQLATVLLMKDRAGTVGAHGVGPLVRDLLRSSGAVRVHLIGHSYGGRVQLSALSFLEPPRPVDSVLLLQPATSYLCFAANVDGQNRAGGYRPALTRSTQPIFTTYSAKDAPLTKFFHIAVRRGADLGDQRIAAVPPSKHAALGGFGPGGLDASEQLDIALPIRPAKYPNPGAVRVVSLNGTVGIGGHGDVSNPATWWALLNQTSRSL